MKKTWMLLTLVAVSLVWLSSSAMAQQEGTVGKERTYAGPILTYNVSGATVGPIAINETQLHRYDKGQFKPGTTINVSGTGRNTATEKGAKVYADGTTSSDTIISASIIYHHTTSSGTGKEERIDSGNIRVGPGATKTYSISASIPANAHRVRIEVSNRASWSSGTYSRFVATLTPSALTSDLQAAPDNLLSAGYRSKRGETFRFRAVGKTTGRVWGTDIYTDNSHPATAAVHAGILRAGQEGVIEITMLEGRMSYTGSTRNGVVSQSWGQFPGSFRFATKAKVSLSPPPPAGVNAIIRGQVTHLVKEVEKGLGYSRVIIGTGFNYRGPSGVAVHELQYKTKIVDMKTDAQGQFVAKVPPGNYDVFIWKECYVPQSYRNVALPRPNIKTQLSRGEGALGSHCPKLRLTYIR